MMMLGSVGAAQDIGAVVGMAAVGGTVQHVTFQYSPSCRAGLFHPWPSRPKGLTLGL